MFSFVYSMHINSKEIEYIHLIMSLFSNAISSAGLKFVPRSTIAWLREIKNKRVNQVGVRNRF